MNRQEWDELIDSACDQIGERLQTELGSFSVEDMIVEIMKLAVELLPDSVDFEVNVDPDKVVLNFHHDHHLNVVCELERPSSTLLPA